MSHKALCCLGLQAHYTTIAHGSLCIAHDCTPLYTIAHNWTEEQWRTPAGQSAANFLSIVPTWSTLPPPPPPPPHPSQSWDLFIDFASVWIVWIVQKENFPSQQTWCRNIFPFTFLFRLSDKRNVVGSNWKCPFENFHFESLKRSRRRGLLMLSDTASLWTRCSSTSGRSAIWTTAHNAHSPPRHRCSFGNV